VSLAIFHFTWLIKGGLGALNSDNIYTLEFIPFIELLFLHRASIYADKDHIASFSFFGGKKLEL